MCRVIFKWSLFYPPIKIFVDRVKQLLHVKSIARARKGSERR